MLKVHSSPPSTVASLVKPLERRDGQGNVSWINQSLQKQTPDTGSIILLGGSNLTHFRLRVAQSHARRDLLPSFWSHVALLGGGAKTVLYEVSLEPAAGFRDVPHWQGIQVGNLDNYDDPTTFPNVGIIHWKLKSGTLAKPFDETLRKAVERLYMDRGTVDILSPLWAWLGYAWGVADQANPLLRGIGIPSAVLVESVFSMIGIELTPGLASQSSCPEAIWQAAKWWGDFYDSESALTDGRPTGAFHLGQPAAAVIEEQRRGKPSGGKTPKPGRR